MGNLGMTFRRKEEEDDISGSAVMTLIFCF